MRLNGIGERHVQRRGVPVQRAIRRSFCAIPAAMMPFGNVALLQHSLPIGNATATFASKFADTGNLTRLSTFSGNTGCIPHSVQLA